MAFVDLDTFPGIYSDPGNNDWILPKVMDASKALGFHNALLFSACSTKIPDSFVRGHPSTAVLSHLASVYVDIAVCLRDSQTRKRLYYEGVEGLFWVVNSTKRSPEPVESRRGQSTQQLELGPDLVSPVSTKTTDDIYIFIVLCMKTGDIASDIEQKALLESLLASILLTSHSSMTIHIVSNAPAQNHVAQVALWADRLHLSSPHRKGLSFKVILDSHMIPNPFMEIFRPCTLVRLDALHLIDPHVSNVLYLDTDMIVLNDIADLWHEFKTSQKGASLGAAAEHGCVSR